VTFRKHFAERALNRANTRKEFFFTTPGKVRDVLLSKVGNLLEFTETVEAIKYRQSVGLRPTARDAVEHFDAVAPS